MRLDGQVPVVGDKGLVDAMRAARDALGAGRNAEGVAMPLECEQRLARRLAEPFLRQRAGLELTVLGFGLLFAFAAWKTARATSRPRWPWS